MGFFTFRWKGSTAPSLSHPSSPYAHDEGPYADESFSTLVSEPIRRPKSLRTKGSNSSLLVNPFRTVLASPPATPTTRDRSPSITSSVTTTRTARGARTATDGSKRRTKYGEAPTLDETMASPSAPAVKSSFFGIRGTMSTTSLALTGAEKKRRWGLGDAAKKRMSIFGGGDAVKEDKETRRARERAVKEDGETTGFVVRSFRTISRVYEDPISATGPYESLPYAASSPSLPLSSTSPETSPRRPPLNVRALGESGRNSPTISVEAFHAASARSRSTTSLHELASAPTSRFVPITRRQNSNPIAALGTPRASIYQESSPYGYAAEENRRLPSSSSCLSVSTFATASEGGHGSRRNSTFESDSRRTSTMRPLSGLGWDEETGVFRSSEEKRSSLPPPLPTSPPRTPYSSSTLPNKRTSVIPPSLPYLASRSTPSLSLQPASPGYPPPRSAAVTSDPASWGPPAPRPITRPRVSFNDRPSPPSASSPYKGKSVAVIDDDSSDEDDVPLARLSQVRSASTSDLSLRPRSMATFVTRPPVSPVAVDDDEKEGLKVPLARERTPTRRSMSTFSFATHSMPSTNPLPPPSHNTRSFSSPSTPIVNSFSTILAPPPPPSTTTATPSTTALESDPQRNSSSSSSGSGSGSSLPQTPKDHSPGASVLGSGIKSIASIPSFATRGLVVVGRDSYLGSGQSVMSGARRIGPGSTLAPASERGSTIGGGGAKVKEEATVYGRMKERHKAETRKGIEIGRDLNGPGQMRDPELEGLDDDDDDDDAPLASLPSRSQLGVGPGILKHSQSSSQLGSAPSFVASPQDQFQSPLPPFQPRPPSVSYAHLSHAPPGVDPYLYASLPPDQRLSLHQRAAQMMQLMAQAAQQAKAESVAGWETGSNGSRGSVASNASASMYGGGGGGGMYGGGLGMGMGGMGMMGMPPQMGMPMMLGPQGGYGYGYSTMPPPGSRLPPFAPSRATSQPFFQQPPPLLSTSSSSFSRPLSSYPQSSIAFMGQAPPPAPLSSIGTSPRIPSEFGSSARPQRESRRSFSSGTSLVGASSRR